MSTTRRPASVWIAQILILLFGVPFTLVALFAFFSDLGYLAQMDQPAVEWLRFLFFVTLRIGLAIFLSFAFWGLAKRKRYGRWMAVAFISFLVLLSVLGQIFRPTGPLGYHEYENSAQRMGGIFAAVIIYGLCAFLLYRLAFGEKVSEFFNPPHAESSQEPPPPDAYFT